MLYHVCKAQNLQEAGHQVERPEKLELPKDLQEEQKVKQIFNLMRRMRTTTQHGQPIMTLMQMATRMLQEEEEEPGMPAQMYCVASIATKKAQTLCPMTDAQKQAWSA